MTSTFRSLSVSLAVLACCCASALAAPPALPAAALGDDVIGILWIDALTADSAKLKSAIDRGMGRYSREVHDALAPFVRMHPDLVRAGCTSMAAIYFEPSIGREIANPVFLFSMSKPTDRVEIESVLRAGTVDREGKSPAKFEKLGDWLVAYDKTKAAPYFDKGKPERMQAFRSALSPIASHPAVLAFVPCGRFQRRVEAELRSDVGEQMPDKVVDFNLLAAGCISVAAAVTLGDEPSLAVTVTMADGESAQKLSDLRPAVVAAIDPFMKRADFRGVYVELISHLALLHSIVSNLSPQVTGPQLVAQVKAEGLSRMANGIGFGFAAARDEALVVRSMKQMKTIILALNSYAEDHEGHYPKTLEDLGKDKYVSNLKELLKNPITGEDSGFIYVRPSVTIYKLVGREDLLKSKLKIDLSKKGRDLSETLAARTPILYESRNGRIHASGLIGYPTLDVSRGDIKSPR